MSLLTPWFRQGKGEKESINGWSLKPLTTQVLKSTCVKKAYVEAFED